MLSCSGVNSGNCEKGPPKLPDFLDEMFTNVFNLRVLRAQPGRKRVFDEILSI